MAFKKLLLQNLTILQEKKLEFKIKKINNYIIV